MQWTWKAVPLEALNRVLLRQSQGKVNKTDFVGPPYVVDDIGTSVTGETYPAGTLLLMHAQPIIKFQPDGRFCLDVLLTIRYDPTGHNKIFDWEAVGLAPVRPPDGPMIRAEYDRWEAELRGRIGCRVEVRAVPG